MSTIHAWPVERDLPAPLAARVDALWAAYREAAATAAIAPPEPPASLPVVWAASDFVAKTCIRHPELLVDLLDSGDLLRDFGPQLRTHLESRLRGAGDEAQLGEVLRRLRRREMVRIAWRDLAGLAELAETTGDLSILAETCMDVSLELLHAWQSAELGMPCDQNGTPQSLVVLGMGKLGAGELNFSSDVDLIFAYPEDGETRGGARALGNEQFFIRLGQRLIAALSAPTAHGSVFRVDMRLRPFGSSGPLALSFDALEEYYQVHGREWERYAMVKARVVAGDQSAGAQLTARLKPFVYRRYLDYGAFESLRDMKQLIVQEVRRKGLEDNIKLGAGGIREVEFIAQAFQLIRGGRDPRLQERNLLQVLPRLAESGCLPQYVVDRLRDAYVFLRHTEHRLQEYADQQTHQLPTDDEGRLRLAVSMGFADWEGFAATLQQHRDYVRGHFEQVFEAPQTRHAEADALDLSGVWREALGADEACRALASAGYAAPEEALEVLAGLREAHSVRALTDSGRRRLDRLVPLLLGAAGQGGRPLLTLRRVAHLLEVVARRTAYLALLVEHPMALSQLVKLCSASPWVTALLTRHPLLLDELLDPRSLYRPPDRAGLADELRQRLLRIPIDDLEQQIDALRHFKQAHTLRVAAADVAEALPLMVVSDHLTWLAEVILDEVLELAWGHLVQRHGRPICTEDGRVCDKGFAIIGYGKLGGIELGYGSDLDLVFLHGGENEAQLTDGERPVENAVFFARLGQRIIHILTAHTPAGVLYEVDTRLRPSGASGLLVSGWEAFADYQRNEAWTWEHQALVRARVVAGDQQIAERFEAARAEIVGRQRDPAVLREEVRAMRTRMREALGKHDPTVFDLKHDAGGIADIEFMVQYGVLMWANSHPELLRYTDNIRLLDAFADAGLVPRGQTELLAHAYRTYRAEVHRLTLQEEPAVVAAERFGDLRAEIGAAWRAWMDE